MRRTRSIWTLILICVTITNLSAPLFAETKKPKEVILTTADIKDSYKVIGIISVRSGDVTLDAINDKLKQQAAQLGANYVVGVNYLTYSGYLFAYGTAVKIKE
ncbi:MAG: hypothetical protein V1933_04405 [Candidatus Omnitrophota bacterium]